MGNSKIKIEAMVAAPAAKVWDCWTKPEHITGWNFASDDWHCPRAQNDPRTGGKFSSRMEAKDGSFGFDFEGVYDNVIEQKKISYSMEDGRQVTTEFESVGHQTKVTTTFDAEKQNPEEMQREGWQAILNNFKKYTEGH